MRPNISQRVERERKKHTHQVWQHISRKSHWQLFCTTLQKIRFKVQFNSIKVVWRSDQSFLIVFFFHTVRSFWKNLPLWLVQNTHPKLSSKWWIFYKRICSQCQDHRLVCNRPGQSLSTKWSNSRTHPSVSMNLPCMWKWRSECQRRAPAQWWWQLWDAICECWTVDTNGQAENSKRPAANSLVSSDAQQLRWAVRGWEGFL